jgi:hypothetical protein
MTVLRGRPRSVDGGALQSERTKLLFKRVGRRALRLLGYDVHDPARLDSSVEHGGRPLQNLYPVDICELLKKQVAVAAVAVETGAVPENRVGVKTSDVDRTVRLSIVGCETAASDDAAYVLQCLIYADDLLVREHLLRHNLDAGRRHQNRRVGFGTDTGLRYRVGCLIFANDARTGCRVLRARSRGCRIIPTARTSRRVTCRLRFGRSLRRLGRLHRHRRQGLICTLSTSYWCRRDERQSNGTNAHAADGMNA